MVANRGYESTQAKTRLSLIEAASDLLADEGFPAISARRIASRAGLKPQLVHYYFRSMEELVVTVFYQSSARYLALLEEALSSPRPLHAVWELNSHIPEAKRVFEFVALSKQYPLLRQEMREAGERFRSLHVQAIEKAYAENGILEPEISPPVLATLMSAVARNLLIEEQVGVASSHEETRALILRYLARIER
jgi:AcrR family transcriptional regulator